MSSWIIREEEFDQQRIELNGSRFTIGNGYFGYRGTLDEFTKEQLCALTLAGIYDDANGWREIVNVPNPLYTRIFYEEKELSVLTSQVLGHHQELDLKSGVLKRITTYGTEDGNEVTFTSERAAGCEDVGLLLSSYRVVVKNPGNVQIKTGFDKDLWECNGPHFETLNYAAEEDILYAQGKTGELKKEITLAQCIHADEAKVSCEESEKESMLVCSFKLGESQEAKIVKYIYIVKENNKQLAKEKLLALKEAGYSAVFQKMLHEKEVIWEQADIEIVGDEEAQLAVRHNIYLLLTAAPFDAKAIAIPARGLSGQVYKGAMFWDTEMYMLPMFIYEFPEVARNLVMYRIHNLSCALEKAKEYGHYGAFYPWESQETGQEGCTHYNLEDLFTGRKVRTYFRDKQIHISADVAYGIWKYYEITGDITVLEEDGAKTMLECSRFFCSWAYYKKDKKRYEFLDVTGADEYHERVQNNFYTNAMIQFCLEKTLEALDILKEQCQAAYKELGEGGYLETSIADIQDLCEKIYVPQPNQNGVIEQFDGYFNLEDLSLEEIKKRIIKPNEYLGSPTGLCVETQIGKQADVVLLLSTLCERYTQECKKSNLAYYEPRTEHGSSLSTCIYALLAAQIGDADWAYRYFMKTAQLDLKGDYKLYLGPLYIGGTHPAANGGTWRTLVEGFCGFRAVKDTLELNSHLPAGWESVRFKVKLRQNIVTIVVTGKSYTIEADAGNQQAFQVRTKEGMVMLNKGELLKVE